MGILIYNIKNILLEKNTELIFALCHPWHKALVKWVKNRRLTLCASF